MGVSPEAAATTADIRDMAGQPVQVADYPILRALRGEAVGTVELMVGPAGGPHREVVSYNAQIVGADGVVLGAVSILTDVSVERTSLRQLAEEHQLLLDGSGGDPERRVAIPEGVRPGGHRRSHHRPRRSPDPGERGRVHPAGSAAGAAGRTTLVGVPGPGAGADRADRRVTPDGRPRHLRRRTSLRPAGRLDRLGQHAPVPGSRRAG